MWKGQAAAKTDVIAAPHWLRRTHLEPFNFSTTSLNFDYTYQCAQRRGKHLLLDIVSSSRPVM